MVRTITTDPPTNNEADFVTMHPLNAMIQSITFDSTGSWLASTANDGSIRVRTVGGNLFVKEDEFPNVPVNDASFNADGNRLAVVSQDGRLEVFSVPTEIGVELIQPIGPIGRPATSVAFSLRSGDNRFAIGLDNERVQLWEIKTDDTITRIIELITTADIPSGSINTQVGISRDGNWLAAGIGTGISAWNLNNLGAAPKLFREHTALITRLTFSESEASSSLLASSSRDGTILLWEVDRDLSDGAAELWNLSEPSLTANVSVTTQIRVRIPVFDGVNTATLTPFNFQVEGTMQGTSQKTYSKTLAQYSVDGGNTCCLSTQ